MEFGDRLIRGEIVKSYKKLILDVKFREGGVVPVFCPELDYMQNLYVPGTEIWVVKNRDQRRRLRYECQIVNSGGGKSSGSGKSKTVAAGSFIRVIVSSFSSIFIRL